MAETTPGPLIQVVQFVGYLGAYDQHGPLSPILAGIAGSLLATWVTFVPSFLWIFLGAPYVERLRDHAALRAALSVIGAAVVGVVLNLSIWFGLHVIFARVNEQRWGVIRLLVPDLSSIDLVALAINVFACLAMFQFKIGMGRTLFVSAILGICYQLVREVM
jgi:chromate transporter